MTASELMQAQIDMLTAQVEACYAGLGKNDFDREILPQMMRPSRMLDHLAECVHAFLAKKDGADYDQWGVTGLTGTLEERMATYRELREQAKAGIAGREDEKALIAASDFLTAHDAYHVGQLVTMRLTIDPEWNAYSIYGHIPEDGGQ